MNHRQITAILSSAAMIILGAVLLDVTALGCTGVALCAIGSLGILTAPGFIE